MADKKKFIAEAIEKAGSLRRHFNVKKGETIPIGRMTSEKGRLQRKAKTGTLSASERRLLRRIVLAETLRGFKK
jgi:hypothetical protein